MTLIATDLDRTLIFSEKFAARHPSDLELLPCEDYHGRNVSLMAASVRRALVEVAAQTTLMPVTTRTVAQYQRLDLGVDVPWVICCSGGVVLRTVDGALEPDVAWSRRVAEAIEAECADRAELVAELDRYAGSPWLREVRDGGGLFLIAIVDSTVLASGSPTFSTETAADLADLIHAGRVRNWRVVHQGSKVYLLPRVMTKSAAVEHVRQILTAEDGVRPRLLAAGDSILDWDMVCHADAGWTSIDGELAVLGRRRDTVVRSVRGGVESSLDLVDAWRRELAADHRSD